MRKLLLQTGRKRFNSCGSSNEDKQGQKGRFFQKSISLNAQSAKTTSVTPCPIYARERATKDYTANSCDNTFVNSFRPSGKFDADSNFLKHDDKETVFSRKEMLYGSSALWKKDQVTQASSSKLDKSKVWKGILIAVWEVILMLFGINIQQYLAKQCSCNAANRTERGKQRGRYCNCNSTPLWWKLVSFMLCILAACYFFINVRYFFE